MRLLYIGDIMGGAGMHVVQHVLPGLRQERQIDLVLAQAENVSEGKGLTVADFEALKKCGVDFCTAGNWTLHRDEIFPALNDPNQPVIRPANYPEGTPGLGYKYIDTSAGKVLVISLLGQIIGRDADKPVQNPLQCIDAILAREMQVPRAATIVNFHGDYSSEKRVIGYYLDGRVAVVVGDHWHVPTADAMILPRGTAHITDVGMCGALDSSLGVKLDVIIRRWQSGQQSRNELENNGRMQFNALYVEIDHDGLATSVEHIQLIDEE
jgi:2',3'-cyclic-nucleotide 2'-phosphodiesterase